MSGLTREIRGGLALLGLDRPQRANAYDQALLQQLHLELEGLARNPEVRALVVHAGSCRHFCAGADREELDRRVPEDAPQLLARRVFDQLARWPRPTVAALRGACLGGGLELALACDLRLAGPRSRFAITPAKLGLVYSADDSRRLVNAVGMARAREMLLTGRLLDAATALDWGLVHQLAGEEGLEALEQAQLASLLATSGQARRGIKTVLGHLGGDPAITLDQANAAFNDAFASRDFAEGAQAFLEKRAPSFS